MPYDRCKSVCNFLLLSTLLLTFSWSTFASDANDASCLQLSNLRGWSTLTPVARARVPANVCASIWVNTIGVPRGILTLPNRKGVLVVLSNDGTIRWFNDTNENGSIDRSLTSEETTIIEMDGLNHGIVLWNENRLFASTATTVYSWTFDINNPSAAITSTPTIVVSGIPADGHSTRTLIIDPTQTWLYISVGSNGNIDTDISNRSLIKRYRLSDLPSGGFTYASGETFASGLRNEVGLDFDKYSILWGVENGADRLERDDLGGDIHNDNPGEEINKFVREGQFYGYPYCFSEWELSNYGLGMKTQWSWPDFMNDGTHNDEWCRNTTNNIPPQSLIEAHTAPLGMKFYDSSYEASTFTSTPFTFPSGPNNEDYLYIPQHGSWNREPPVGYRVQRVRLNDSGTEVTLSTDEDAIEDFFSFDSTDGSATSEDWKMRPVDITIGPDGEIYLSSDGGQGTIVALRYVRDFNQTVRPVLPSASSTGSGDPSIGGGNDGAHTSLDRSYLILITLLAWCIAVAVRHA